MDISNLLKLIGIQDAAAAVSNPEDGVNTLAQPISQDFDPNYANTEAVPELPAMMPQLPKVPLLPKQMAKAPISVPSAPASLPEGPKVPLEQKLPMLSSNEPDDLALALEQSRKDQNINNMLRAGNAIASGAARYAGSNLDLNAANSVLGEADKLAGAKASDILTKRKAEGEKVERAEKELDFNSKKNLSDPKSAESLAMREQVLSLFPEYKDMPGFKDATGKQLDDTFKFLNLKEQMEARKQVAKDNREARRDAQQDKLDAKKDDSLEKEQIQVRKEDRKTRKDLDTAENALTANINMIKDAKKAFEKYSKESWTGGTGSIATLGGLTGNVSQKTEALRSKFKKVALDDMVKMFAGMSKAVDSDAERRAFESTQPGINLDDATNAAIFEDKLKAAESLLAKTKLAKARFDKTDSFEPSEQEAQAPSPEDASAARQKRIAELKAKQGK